MTQRLTLEHPVSRSETIRTGLDLLLDDPPVGPTAQPSWHAVVQVPGVSQPATLGAAENDE